MTATDIALLIASVGTFVTCLGNVIVSVLTARKVEQVHVATNSMKDALVTATAEASHAEGLAEGRAEKNERG